MVNCVAFGCSNKTPNKKTGYKPPAGITFHRFPNDDHLRKKWTVAVSRKDWEPSKWSHLCSAHFREADIDRTSLACVRLREGAVPCVFPAQGKERPKERNPSKRTIEEVYNTSEPFVGVIESPRRKKLKQELDRTKGLLVKSKRKVKALNEKKRRLTKKIAKLKTILNVLKDKLNIAEENCSLLNSISKTSASLMKRSLEKNTNPKLRKIYDDRLKAFAITLHFLSPKAYRFVRKTFDTALPHPRTLCRWYSTVEGEPGFSQEILRALTEYTKRNGKTLCSFMLDSMAIRKQIEFDGKKFHGTVNVGVSLEDDNAPLAKEALVFNIVFLKSHLKVPVGYFFVNGVTGNQLSALVKQGLTLLHEAGMAVTSLTCDGAACNISMGNILGCNLNKVGLTTHFPHPCTQEPVFFFLDPSHMIKLVRNTLGDLKLLIDGNENEVEWRFIESLYNLQTETEMHLGNKLTKSHIEYWRQKMKVKLAAQLFSTSVADSLKFLSDNKYDQFLNCSATVKFIMIFNDLFDILNSRSINEKYKKQALHSKNIEITKAFLKEAKEYILQLKNKEGKSICDTNRKTGFIGFLICIESAIGMYDRYVLQTSPDAQMKFLPLYKISQDHLERLFGYIRSRGGHNNNPSCRQFSSTFKRILLHKELEEGGSGNCLVLDRSFIFDVKSKQTHLNAINSSLPEWRSLEETTKECLLSVEEDEDLNIPFCQSDLEFNIIEYIAGYIVRSISTKLLCHECVLALRGNKNPDVLSLIASKDRGGLIQPSESVVKICGFCENSFRSKFKLLDENISVKENNVIEVLTNKVLGQCVGVDLFPESTHFSGYEMDNNHFCLVIKMIAQKYFNVRVRYYCKISNESLHKNKVRQHLNKTVIFLGQ